MEGPAPAVPPDHARERGAAAVEFALVLMPLLLLMFGIIEYGFYFADSINLRQAAREGARQGSVANWGSTTACGLVFGATPSDDVKRLMCQIHENHTVTDGPVRVKVRFVNPATGANTAYAANLNVAMRVCVMAKHEGLTGLVPFPRNAVLRSRTDTLVEKSVTPTQTAGEESALTGGDWSWC